MTSSTCCLAFVWILASAARQGSAPGTVEWNERESNRSIKCSLKIEILHPKEQVGSFRRKRWERYVFGSPAGGQEIKSAKDCPFLFGGVR